MLVINMINRYSNILKNQRYPAFQYRKGHKNIEARIAEEQKINSELRNWKINSYLFRKYQINLEIQNSLRSLQKQMLAFDGNYSSEEIGEFQETLQHVELDLITSSTIKQFKNIFQTIKEKGILEKVEEFEGKLLSASKVLSQTFSNPVQIIRQYRFGKSENRTQNSSKVVLSELQNIEGEALPVEDYLEVFKSLINTETLNRSERKIRLILMRRINIDSVSFQIEALVSVSKVLNSVSHYDFLPQELQITQNIFNTLQGRSIELKLNIELCKQLLAGNKYNKNSLSLSQLFNEILPFFINAKKRINSSQAHQAFNLIVLANRKIKKYLQNEIYLSFLLRYIQVNGKTKKHNQNINKGLQILASTDSLPNSVIQKIVLLLHNINFIPTIGCLYHLIIGEGQNMFDNTIIDKFILVAISHLKEQQALQFIRYGFSISWVFALDSQYNTAASYAKEYLLFAFALHKSGSSVALKNRQKMDEALINISKQTNFQGIQKLLSSFDSQEFYSIFYEVFRNHILNLPSFANFDLMYFLIKCFNFKREEIIFLSNKLNHQTVSTILQRRLKQYSNECLQKFLVILYPYQQDNQIINQVSCKLIISLLTRLAKSIKDNSLSKPAQFHFWVQVTNLIKNRFEQALVEDKEGFFNLVQLLFTHFSSDSTEYWLNSNIYYNLAKLIQRYSAFEQDQTLQHQLVKLGLSFNLIDKGSKLLEEINLDNLDYISVQKIKYLKNSSCFSQISQINKQSLQIILFNPNNHYLLEQYKQEIGNIVGKATASELQQYIISFNQTPQLNLPYKISSIIYALANNLNPLTFNPYLIFKQIDNKNLLSLPPTEILLKKWIIEYILERHQYIGDFETHQVILTLLSKCKEQKDMTVLNKYLQILFNQLSYYPTTYAVQQFYQKFIYTNYKFQRHELAKMAESTSYFLLPRLFFFLQPQFLEQERYMLINKINKIIETEYQKKTNKQKIQIISDYQYRYLVEKYSMYFPNKLIQRHFKNERFSQFSQKDRKLLAQIAVFQRTTLIKRTEFGQNQIYQINKNYIINIDFKQSAIYEFSYYQRLLKAFYGPKIRVVITLNSLLTEKQWNQFFFIRKARQNSKDPSKEMQQESQGEYFKQIERKKYDEMDNKDLKIKLLKASNRRQNRIKLFKKDFRK